MLRSPEELNIKTHVCASPKLGGHRRDVMAYGHLTLGANSELAPSAWVN